MQICYCAFFSTAVMEKSVERSFQDQLGGKDDSRKIKKKSAMASSKLGAARCTNRDKLLSAVDVDGVMNPYLEWLLQDPHSNSLLDFSYFREPLAGIGDRLDKSQQQSNLKQVSKFHQTPITKRKLQKTAGVSPGPKAASVYNLRGKNQITEGAPSYNLRSKVHKTEDQNAPINIQNRKTPKKDGFKDSSVAIQKKGVLKNSAKPIKKIETMKHLPLSLADLCKKNHPLTSQHELFTREPIYHIRWEGEDVKNGPLGQNCILCNKDLSCATEDDDSESDDDFQYDDDDDDDDEYYDDLNPPLLPAVDVLSCGHAYHTECLQKGTPKEQSSDPQCILCYKMS
ncbi:hypothetical protein L1987_77709 [Smallanthus sonchifolius]|uniref:Uncharacterized protein n=1 Tax=Smallanthus sonchifolius TaxID=185202 RepID=A0ACB8Z9S7_9ASTR|nr:hypothetical protein L1987_77709 [Smallanthus sonchifolius]